LSVSYNQGANDPRVDLLLDNLHPDGGTDKLFRNVGYQPQTTLLEHQEKKKKASISVRPRQKPEITWIYRNQTNDYKVVYYNNS
jgi:hypothetical protein